jgi:hypothetical protein
MSLTWWVQHVDFTQSPSFFEKKIGAEDVVSSNFKLNTWWRQQGDMARFKLRPSHDSSCVRVTESESAVGVCVTAAGASSLRPGGPQAISG